MKQEIKYNGRLKSAMVNKKVTQGKLALDIGVPEAYISRIVRGRQVPTQEEMEKIAQRLGVEIKDIF